MAYTWQDLKTQWQNMLIQIEAYEAGESDLETLNEYIDDHEEAFTELAELPLSATSVKTRSAAIIGDYANPRLTDRGRMLLAQRPV